MSARYADWCWCWRRCRCCASVSALALALVLVLVSGSSPELLWCGTRAAAQLYNGIELALLTGGLRCLPPFVCLSTPLP